MEFSRHHPHYYYRSNKVVAASRLVSCLDHGQPRLVSWWTDTARHANRWNVPRRKHVEFLVAARNVAECAPQRDVAKSSVDLYGTHTGRVPIGRCRCRRCHYDCPELVLTRGTDNRYTTLGRVAVLEWIVRV